MLSTHIFGFEKIYQPKITSIGQGNSVIDFGSNIIIGCNL
jgi:hypothetical protein